MCSTQLHPTSKGRRAFLSGIYIISVLIITGVSVKCMFPGYNLESTGACIDKIVSELLSKHSGIPAEKAYPDAPFMDRLICVWCIGLEKVCEELPTTAILCEASGNCLNIQLELNNGSILLQRFQRTCTTGSIVCNQYGGLSFGKSQIRMITKCCNINHCDPGEVELPAMDPRVNGLHCPWSFCYGLHCTGGGTVRCTGDERRCLEISVKEIFGLKNDISIQGCATENLCGSEWGDLIKASNAYKLETYLCSSENYVQQDFFLPTVSGLFLMMGLP